MSLRNKGLVLAMEDDSEIEPGTGELAETLVEVAESAAEIEEGTQEVAEYDEAIDSAADDAETLEKIHDVMEESVEKGEGLDETSAEIAEIAIESICARLGITKRTMPAMESFGSANSRLVATKIAMEGITERLKGIWEAIKKAFIAMLGAIKDFYKKYMTAIGRAKEALSKVEAAVKAFNKTKAKSDVIENASLAEAFAVDGKADASTANTVLTNHLKLTSAVLKSLGAIKDVSKDISKDGADLQKASQDFVNEVGKSSGVLIDGNSVEFKAPETSKKGFYVEFSLTFGKDGALKGIETLDKVGMTSVVKVLQNLVKLDEDYAKNEAVIKQISDEIVRVADAQSKLAETIAKAEGEEKATIQANAEKAAASARSVKALLGAVTTKVPSMNLKAIQKGIGYIEASMKNYE